MKTGWQLKGPLVTRLGRVTMAGVLREHSGIYHQPLRRFGMYAVVLVLRGTGRYRDEHGGPRELEAGSVVWVFPEVAQAYGPDPGGVWDEIYVAFAGPAFDLWRAQGLLDPAWPLGRVIRPLLWARRLRDSLTRQGEGVAGFLAFQQVLAALWERTGRGRQTDSPWLEEARRILDPWNGRPPRQAAAQLGCSYESFRKRFAEQAGLSPEEYRRRQRLGRAAAMLRKGEWSLRQIAEQTGFYDEFHLSKSFKQHWGMAPRDYREKVAGHKSR